jgi:putative RNA 2'-phosphotransferase
MIRKCNEHGYFRGELCPECNTKGRYVLGDRYEERLGKFVSGALRHFPNATGLEMDKKGWVNLDQFYNVLKQKYKWATKESLISLVESDIKNRYEIDGGYLRACYGHSVDVELDHCECELPYLYYGVSQEEADMILENGIKPVHQQYVHLSTSYDKANDAAQVHTDNPIIIKIDADVAREAGMSFMSATDEIVLAKQVPSEYLSIANFG